MILGTCLTIYIPQLGPNWLTQALSLRLPVFIGLISYSLYLWHWPILVFARYFEVRALSSPQIIAALFLMFAMSVLSWRFIEHPFRDRSLSVKTLMLWTVAGGALVVLSSTAMIAGHSFPTRLSPEAAKINAATGTEFRCNVRDYIAIGASRGCIMPSLNSRDPHQADVILLGNSHAQMYEPLVDQILQTHHLSGLLIPANGCLPTPELNVSVDCSPIAAKNLAAVEGLLKARFVILAMDWPMPNQFYKAGKPVARSENAALIVQALSRLMAELQAHGKTVVLVGPIAKPGWDVASNTSRELAFHRERIEPTYTSLVDFHSQFGGILRAFSAQPDITFIRPDQIQCSSGRCDYFRDGESLFADDGHLAEAALRFFQPAFETGLNKAFQLQAPIQ